MRCSSTAGWGHVQARTHETLVHAVGVQLPPVLVCGSEDLVLLKGGRTLPAEVAHHANVYGRLTSIMVTKVVRASYTLCRLCFFFEPNASGGPLAPCFRWLMALAVASWPKFAQRWSEKLPAGCRRAASATATGSTHSQPIQESSAKWRWANNCPWLCVCNGL